MKLAFLGRFSKNTPLSNFMIIHSVGAEKFHADGQTGTKKLTVVFRKFTNALNQLFTIHVETVFSVK
jgi:hypothetical protein